MVRFPALNTATTLKRKAAKYGTLSDTVNSMAIFLEGLITQFEGQFVTVQVTPQITG
jgi:hypothetical protein